MDLAGRYVLELSEDRSDAFQRRTGITGRDLDILVRLPLFTGLQPAVLRALLSDAWGLRGRLKDVWQARIC